MSGRHVDVVDIINGRNGIPARIAREQDLSRKDSEKDRYRNLYKDSSLQVKSQETANRHANYSVEAVTQRLNQRRSVIKAEEQEISSPTSPTSSSPNKILSNLVRHMSFAETKPRQKKKPDVLPEQPARERKRSTSDESLTREQMPDNGQAVGARDWSSDLSSFTDAIMSAMTAVTSSAPSPDESPQKESESKSEPLLPLRRNSPLSAQEQVDQFDHVYALRDTVLGTGAFATVHLAEHRRLKRKVAVKYVQKDRFKQQCLQNEAKILSTCSHTNLLSLEGCWVGLDNTVMVVELADGGSLQSLMKEKGRFTEAEVLEIMRQLLSALAYLHDNQVIHRDIKPDNILFTKSSTWAAEQLKLCDLGFATREPDGNVSQMERRQFCGSPPYMSPELVVDHKDCMRMQCYNCTVDVWAGGVIMFMMLYEHHPWKVDCGVKVPLNTTVPLLRRCFGSIPLSFPKQSSGEPVSSEAKDLMAGMLSLSPDARMSSRLASSHACFSMRNRIRLMHASATEYIAGTPSSKQRKEPVSEPPAVV